MTGSGTLFTPGAIDFFRILSQQVAIIETMNDHGEVLAKVRVLGGGAGRECDGKGALCGIYANVCV